MNKPNRAPTRRRVITAIAAIATVLVAGRVAASDLARPEPAPPAATSTPDDSETGRRVMGAVPRVQPTGLTLLVPGWLLDIDSGRSYPVDVDGWLSRPGHDPLLVEWEGDPDHLGPIEVSSRLEPILPGSPVVTQLNGYQAVPFTHPSPVEFEWPEPEPEPPLAYPILVLHP